MLQEKYFDSDWNDNSVVRQSAKKYMSTKNNDLKNIITALNRIEPTSIEKESNISSTEKQALKELKTLCKTVIEIKKADKTDVWWIMDKEDYREKLVLKEHLNREIYKKATKEGDMAIIKEFLY